MITDISQKKLIVTKIKKYKITKTTLARRIVQTNKNIHTLVQLMKELSIIFM